LSGQLESRHFFRENDKVQRRDGLFGTVSDSRPLFAIILWDDGTKDEVDQFDPAVVVIERAEHQ
jgi:hypothetical protein